MQAGAADGRVLLHEGDREAEVVGVQRGGVAPGATADDGNVVHGSLLGRPGEPSVSDAAIRPRCRGAVRFPLVQTRYLLIASLVTALAIVGASVIWFVMAFS
jgi:hypothetical protein